MLIELVKRSPDQIKTVLQGSFSSKPQTHTLSAQYVHFITLVYSHIFSQWKYWNNTLVTYLVTKSGSTKMPDTVKYVTATSTKVKTHLFFCFKKCVDWIQPLSLLFNYHLWWTTVLKMVISGRKWSLLLWLHCLKEMARSRFGTKPFLQVMMRRAQ